ARLTSDGLRHDAGLFPRGRPVFMPFATPGRRIAPGRDVAGGKNPGRIRSSLLVADDAIVEPQARRGQPFDIGQRAEAGDHEIGLDAAALPPPPLPPLTPA